MKAFSKTVVSLASLSLSLVGCAQGFAPAQQIAQQMGASSATGDSNDQAGQISVPGTTATPFPSSTPRATTTPRPNATPVQTTPTPRPSATPAPTPTPGPSANDINIQNYGAVASASANNLSAIQNAINAAAKAKVNVYVPPGVFGYSGVIRLPGPVKFYGAGAASELRSLDPYNETIMVTGNGAKVSKLKLTMAPNNVGRQDPLECQRVTLNKATNFEVSDIIIEGSSAAGIMSWGGQHGVITRNRISNTLADSIHMTMGSAYIDVTSNEISGSGDDGVAVVSYQRDGTLSHDVTASNNVIYANTWGRGMTVVGGTNVTYTNNYVHDVPGASCFYIAQENYYVTYPSSNVVLKNNTAKNCGGGGGNHGGFLIWGDGQANNNITLDSNLISQPAGSGKPGISVTSLNSNISLVSNKLENANVYIQTPNQVVKNTPYSAGSVGYVAP